MFGPPCFSVCFLLLFYHISALLVTLWSRSTGPISQRILVLSNPMRCCLHVFEKSFNHAAFLCLSRCCSLVHNNRHGIQYSPLRTPKSAFCSVPLVVNKKVQFCLLLRNSAVPPTGCVDHTVAYMGNRLPNVHRPVPA